MKLTAASLAAQSAEAFDGSPEVAGELEAFVRYVLSKDEKLLLVADAKDKVEKERLARFEWTALPDGCGKGAKVKLSGIQFVKKVGRDYNGKTYYDNLYSFESCEVLEAGEKRGFGGGGGKGGWQPRAPMSPEERASIEAQSITSSAATAMAGIFHGQPQAAEADSLVTCYDRLFDAMWAKVQKAKASVPRQPQDTGSASQQQAAPAATPAGKGVDTTPPKKTQPAKSERCDDDPSSVYEAVRATRSEVEAFRKAIGNAIGVFDEESVDAAVARAGKELYGDAYGAKGIEFLSDTAQAAIVKLLREE